MKLEVVDYIGAVVREVRSRDYKGRAARVVVATCNYPTNMEDVWDAITNPDRIARCFLPVSGDMRLGGRYQLQGNAGGEITECNPPNHFEITWEYGGDVSWVIVNLSAQQADQTRLRLEHIAHVPEERWDQYGPGAVGVGWDMALMGLARHVSGGASVNPAEALEWLTSEEGKEFVRRSSNAWGEASVAGGTPAGAAAEAVKRTTAAYSGES
jgi:uncharacterized protein YndB with AHSA1/START domain